MQKNNHKLKHTHDEEKIFTNLTQNRNVNLYDIIK